jgi:uncharacterized protein (DUF2384 family)
MTPRESHHSAQLVRIIDLLTDQYSAETAALWLRTPQDSLDGARPVDLLGSDEGEARLIGVLLRAANRYHSIA